MFVVGLVVVVVVVVVAALVVDSGEADAEVDSFSGGLNPVVVNSLGNALVPLNASSLVKSGRDSSQ